MAEDRVGKSGYFAHEGDRVEVVKGRKYPIGMRFIVTDVRNGYCFYSNPFGKSFNAYNGLELEFIGDGFEKFYINADNTVIVSTRDEEDAEGNVESFTYDRYGNMVLSRGIRA